LRKSLRVRKVGAVVADDGQEGEVALAGLGDLAAGVDADAVGVQEQADEQGGIVGRLAAGLALIGSVEGVEVELGDGVQEEEDEVALRQAVGGAKGLGGVGLGIPGAILLAAGSDHDRSSGGASGREPASTADRQGWRPKPPADRVQDHR
jgi:hypothetical protein